MSEEKKEMLEMTDEPILVIEEDPEIDGALRVYLSGKMHPLMLADILDAFASDLRGKFEKKELPSMHVMKSQGDA
jgi:hypothetical protein